jgi:hypothetical protein
MLGSNLKFQNPNYLQSSVTIHAHVASYGRHFFSAGNAQVRTYKPNSLNNLGPFLRENETFSQKQRISQWVNPSRRVILWAVMKILNNIWIDASLRDTVELN